MKWVKFDIEGCISGSIRFDLTPAERSVWYELILLAGKSRNPGIVQASSEIAYPLQFIANQLRISKSLLNSTIRKCQDEGRLVVDKSGIHITNWSRYQSDSERLKKYPKYPLDPMPKPIPKKPYPNSQTKPTIASMEWVPRDRVVWD